MSDPKIFLPIIRRIIPNTIANEILSVQPMILNNSNYNVLTKAIVDGKQWYSVHGTDAVYDWVRETFVEGDDYVEVRSSKGVWIDMSEKAFILLKLKWS